MKAAEVKALREENRELRAKLGWDTDYSEVRELRQIVERCVAERTEAEASVRRWEERESAALRRSNAFMTAIESAFVLLRGGW